MKVQLLDGPWFTFILQAETGATRLVQHDGDFPGVARTFGWAGKHDGSAEKIWDAYEFLERKIGESVDDPGYF